MKTRARGRWDAWAFAAGMVVFAFCAHRPNLWPGRAAGLAVAVAALAVGVARDRQLRDLFSLRAFPAYRLAYLPLCAALGAALAAYYRLAQHRAPWPAGLGAFCAAAVAIGAAEEIVYRGFVQGRLRRWGALAAAGAAAGTHAAYKAALFCLPDVPVRADLFRLAVGTAAVGLVFGLMREAFGHLAFPLAAHVAFDAVAYGDLSAAPWWV